MAFLSIILCPSRIHSFTVDQLDLWAPAKGPDIISLRNSIWFQLIPFTSDLEVKHFKRSGFLPSAPSWNSLFGFARPPPLSWAHNSHCWGGSLPTTLGVGFCEQEGTRLGDSLHLCHLASSEERRGTYLPESINAYSVGLCHVHVVGKSQRVQFSELAETPDRLASPSLPSFSFNV